MKIRVIGQRNNSGIGNHFAAFCDALGALEGIELEELDFQNIPAIEAAAQASTPEDVTISLVGMNIEQYFRGLRIQWIVFESTRIPVGVIQAARATDVIWVPSAWGAATLIANGIAAEKIDIVPEGVNGNLFHPYRRKAPGTKPFQFLVVGKYEIRKSYPEIFEAFKQEFGNHSAVELVIKSDYFKDGTIKYEQMLTDIRSHGFENWKLYWGVADIRGVASLYSQADVFVLPTRGEAWGLPLIEAAAAGLPIITTDWSGHMQFLDPIRSSCVMVDYDLAPVDCPEYKSYYPFVDNDWGTWAVPRVDSLIRAMRTAYKKHHTLAQKAVANSKKIRQDFSWANSANTALECLKKRGF
jgi:glycosyltransferase involved in cell wall biosynthesis